MNYLAELRAFDGWVVSSGLSPNARLLWYALMATANAARWKSPLSVPASMLEAKTGLSHASVYRARGELEEVGLISVRRRSGRQSADYTLNGVVSLYEIQANEPSPLASQCDTQNKEDPPVVSQVVSQVVSHTETIYKQNETDNTPSISPPKAPRRKSAFVPPTVEEVRDYCREKGYADVDPAFFVAYYAEADWHDRDGKPVKNWKQRVISWKMREEKAGNTAPAARTAHHSPPRRSLPDGTGLGAGTIWDDEQHEQQEVNA